MSGGAVKATSVLTREEIARLTRKSDLRGAWEVLVTWATIAVTMAAVAVYPRWWTIAIALVVLGNRQLALAILTHDGAHGILMRTPWLNRVIGHWVCGVPNNVSMASYREHHLGHHAHAGTERDPDVSLTAGFPTARARLARRFARDLVGISSVKRIFGIVMMAAGKFEYTAAVDVTRVDTSGRSWGEALRVTAGNLWPYVLFNVVALAALAATGYGWLFGLWWAAYMTTYSVFLRVRAAAEHACTPGGLDPRRSTRTVVPGWFGAALWAPHHVNFHIEHHLLPTVPCYRLPELHALLTERGWLEDACIDRQGYGSVLAALAR